MKKRTKSVGGTDKKRKKSHMTREQEDLQNVVTMVIKRAREEWETN